MASAEQLEAEFLARLTQPPSADALAAARAVLEAPPYKSEKLVPFVRPALALFAISGAPAEVAWLQTLAKKIGAWGKTWSRDWFLRQIASTQAVIQRLADGPAAPRAVPGGPKAHAQWLSIAAKQSADDLPQLLRDFLDGPATQITERAQALISWSKDSRIAAVALEAHRGELVKDLLHPLWPALGNLIAVHADAKVRAAIGELPELAGPKWISQRRGGADSIPKAVPPRAGAPTTALEWEAWVLAAPDDLKRRVLWNDWLLERNDPRSELLTLQLQDRTLTPAEQRRVNALVKKHGRAWLGKVGQIIEQRGLRFERGVGVAVCFGGAPDGRVVVDDPNWATLRDVTVPDEQLSGRLEQRVFAMLPRLTALQGPNVALAARVFEAGAPALERISFALEWGSSTLSGKALKTFLGARFPALRTAQVHAWPVQLKQLEDAKWFAGLEHLFLTRGELKDWLWVLAHPKLQRIQLLRGHQHLWEPEGERFSFLIAREGTGWAMRIVATEAPATAVGRWYDEELIPSLEGVPRKAFTRISLEVPKSRQPPATQKRKLSAWLEG